jgi:hypothetical protein
LRFEIASDAPQDEVDRFLKLTERYCVVYRTIRSRPPADVQMGKV